MSEPVHHHYVPKFYLEGFTRNGTGEDQLHVLDLATGRSWTQIPGEAARIRGFNSAKIAGFGANETEKALSQVETLIAPVIQGIRSAESLPKDDLKLDYLLNFVALSVARVPKFRKIMAAPLVEFAEHHMREIVATPEAYKAFRDEVRAVGRESPQNYEQAKAFVESKEYTVDADPSTHMQLLFLGNELVLEWVSRFAWFLEIADEDAPDFISSDCPVVLIANPRHWEEWELPRPPKAMPTEIIMPLSRRLSLWGFASTRCVAPAPTKADARFVARFNTFVVSQAERYLFSSDGQIAWTDGDGPLGTTASLLALLNTPDAPQ